MAAGITSRARKRGNSHVDSIYSGRTISERHCHRYEVNGGGAASLTFA